MIEHVLWIGTGFLMMVFVLPASVYAMRRAYMAATFDFFKEHCTVCNETPKEDES